MKLPDGTVKVLVEGIKRVKILDFNDNGKFITCDFTVYKNILNDEEDLSNTIEKCIKNIFIKR